MTIDPTAKVKTEDVGFYAEYSKMLHNNNVGSVSVWISWISVFVHCVDSWSVWNNGAREDGITRFFITLTFVVPTAIFHTLFVNYFNPSETPRQFGIRSILIFNACGILEFLVDYLFISYPLLLEGFASFLGVRDFVDTGVWVPLVPPFVGAAYRFDAMYGYLRIVCAFTLIRPSYITTIIIVIVEGLLVVVLSDPFDPNCPGKDEMWLIGVLSFVVYTSECNRRMEYKRSFQAWRKVEGLLATQANLTAMATTANSMKDQFFSYIFHEVRVPLNSLSLGVDMLYNDMVDDSKQLFITMRSQIDQATNILNDVLSMKKLEEGKFKIKRSWFDVFQFMQRTVSCYSDVSVSKGVSTTLRLENSLDPELLYKADSGRLQQVVSNFLSNALKFTPAGGQIVAYAKCVDKEDNKCTLEIGVEDTGCGIPESEISKVFQPYMQVGNDSGMVGTGLGLSISNQLVMLHGGTTGIRSEVGKGSTFYFTLTLKTKKASRINKCGKLSIPSPRSVESAQFDSPHGGRSLTPRAYNPDSKREKILIGSDSKPVIMVVEDSGPSRKLLTRVLEKLNYHAIPIVNGLEAINYFRDEPSNLKSVSVVLMDKQMPIMHGDEATRLLRKMGYTGAIVALTGNALDLDREAFLAAGADYYITKPATVDTLKLLFSDIFKIRSESDIKEE